MPSSRMAVSLFIIGSCSMWVLLFEVFRSADVVVRWCGRRGFSRWLRRLVERVLQDRFDAFVAAGAGKQRAFRRCFYSLRRILRGQTYDAQATPIAHLGMRFVAHDPLKQPRRVRANRLGPMDHSRRCPFQMRAVTLGAMLVV